MTIDPSRISLNFIEKDITGEEPQEEVKPVIKVEEQPEEYEEPQVHASMEELEPQVYEPKKVSKAQVQEVKKQSWISGFLREAQPDSKPLDPKIAIAATAIWTFLLTSI